MKRLLPLALFLPALAGCYSKPVVTQRENRQLTPQAVAYRDFVGQRTAELQRMGGPFKDKDVAQQKALQEAENRFGGDPAYYESTWSLGGDAEARRVQAQTNVNEYFNDKGREK